MVSALLLARPELAFEVPDAVDQGLDLAFKVEGLLLVEAHFLLELLDLSLPLLLPALYQPDLGQQLLLQLLLPFLQLPEQLLLVFQSFFQHR